MSVEVTPNKGSGTWELCFYFLCHSLTVTFPGHFQRPYLNPPESHSRTFPKELPASEHMISSIHRIRALFISPTMTVCLHYDCSLAIFSCLPLSIVISHWSIDPYQNFPFPPQQESYITVSIVVPLFGEKIPLKIFFFFCVMDS